MRTKDGHDVSILDINANNYLVPVGEERVYHVKIEVKQFDPKTGKRISMPRIQKFGQKIWQSNMRLSLRKQGYDFEILHDPSDWERENAERINALNEARLKAQQEQAEKAKAEERERMKAEILAELKAAGLVPTAEVAQEKSRGNHQRKTKINF